jgi:TatD DNase family protein
MNFKLIDTHCHLNFKDYKNDNLEALSRARENSVAIIVVGAEYRTSQRAVEFAQENGVGVYAAIGLHPIHLQMTEVEGENGEYHFVSRGEVYDKEAYKKLAKSKKVVAIGEIGLDYYHLDNEKDIIEQKKLQADVFTQQLDLAVELSLPVIIHCREAHEDVLPILEKYQNRLKGVIHCYSGDLELAKKYNKIGFLISFTGLITFARQWDEVIREIPLDYIMTETDSPYMTPIPFRGQRNEPAYVMEVAKKIADLKGLSLDEVSKVTLDNARRLFALDI